MKRLIGLLVLLALLALGVFLLEKPRIEEQKAVREGKTGFECLFSNVSKESISKVVINDGLTEKTIRKDDDGMWMISDNGADFWVTDSEKIDELLRNITEEITNETLSSRSKDTHNKFEVTETLGTKVEVHTGGDEPTVIFFVGKQGPDFISTYVRRDDSDNVYSVPIQLGTIYGREMNGWRDKRMWDFDPKTITEAKFRFGESVFSVKLDNGLWLLLEPEQGKANSVKVEAELKALSELQGAGFVSKTLEEAFLDNPENEIRLKSADGKETVLYISKEDEGYYNTYVADKPEAILKVPKADLGPLFITAVSQLKVDPELASGVGSPETSEDGKSDTNGQNEITDG